MKTFALNITSRYIHFPVRTGEKKHYINVYCDGKPLTQFNIELTAEPEFYVYFDAENYIGKELTFTSEHFDLSFLSCSDSVLFDDYGENLRPKLCFTPKKGWTNDPNGMFYLDGAYHLFFQHNPYGHGWDNMTWGHAVSNDLFSWKQLPSALMPDERGTIFSGSAIVDIENKSGLGDGTAPPVLLFYTAAGGNNEWSAAVPFTQCMAYSKDGGYTFEKYQNNPVVGHIAGSNRDPKVIKSPNGGFVMALYLDGNEYALLSSDNLIDWGETCRVTVPDCSECPDVFPLTSDGDEKNVKWVFWGASGRYLTGQFDGKSFIPDQPVFYTQAGDCHYAAQTFDNHPDRRIQISWATHEIPNTQFNQSMYIPVDLSLKATKYGERLFSEPVRELDGLFGEASLFEKQLGMWEELTLDEGVCDIMLTSDLPAYELFIGDKKVTMTPSGAAYNDRTTLLSDTSTVRIICDKTLTAIFVNGGELNIGLGDALECRKIRLKALLPQKITVAVKKLKEA